jgi:hypothetical protein
MAKRVHLAAQQFACGQSASVVNTHITQLLIHTPSKEKNMTRNQRNIFALAASVLLSMGAMTAPATAATWTKAQLDDHKKAAKAEYKAAKDACDKLADNEEDICEARAKLVHTRQEAMGEAAYKGTFKAYYDAKIDIAKAQHELEKEQCDDQKGNAKDVCLKDAKARMVTATEDAKASSKSHKAKANAEEEKADAVYAAATERCDAWSGAAKDECVAKVKADMGR